MICVVELAEWSEASRAPAGGRDRAGTAIAICKNDGSIDLRDFFECDNIEWKVIRKIGLEIFQADWARDGGLSVIPALKSDGERFFIETFPISFGS